MNHRGLRAHAYGRDVFFNVLVSLLIMWLATLLNLLTGDGRLTWSLVAVVYGVWMCTYLLVSESALRLA